MSYQSPEAFYLLALTPILLLVAIITWRRRKRVWKKLVAARLLSRLTKKRPAWPHFLTLSLLLAAFATLVFALANPATENKNPTEKENPPARPILLCLDISRSMTTRDVSPDRLQAAKSAALDIVAKFPRAQIGLVIFSGEAWLQVPLTIDHQILRDAISQLDPETLPLGGSDIAAAIRLASQSLQDTRSRKNTLVLLTDGEEHSPGLLRAGSAAATYGTSIHTLGFGTPAGDTIPDLKDPDGLFRDRNGAPVLSRLNEPVLRELASQSGGSYARGNNPDFLQKLTQAVAKSDLAATGSTQSQLASPRYQWFILPTTILIMCALLSRLLPLQFSKKTHAALLLGLFFLIPGHARANEPDRALQAYRADDFATAQKKFQTLAKQQSQKKSARYQLAAATAAYRQNDLPAALQLFSLALLSPEKPIRAEARYALGNTLYQSGLQKSDPEKRARWQEACQQYHRALKLSPDHQAAADNLAFLEKKLRDLPPPKKESSEKKPSKSKPEKNKDAPKKEANPKIGKNPAKPDKKNPPKKENPPEKSETPSIEQADPANAKPKPADHETPEARARRILRQHAKLGQKPPPKNPELPRPEKDW